MLAQRCRELWVCLSCPYISKEKLIIQSETIVLNSLSPSLMAGRLMPSHLPSPLLLLLLHPILLLTWPPSSHFINKTLLSCCKILVYWESWFCSRPKNSYHTCLCACVPASVCAGAYLCEHSFNHTYRCFLPNYLLPVIASNVTDCKYSYFAF